MEKDNYVNCLREIKKIFDKNGINFWLAYGSVLGAVRNNGIIPHDHDIDLAADKRKFNSVKFLKELTKDFEKRGYVIYFYFNVINIDKGNTRINVLLYNVNQENKDSYVIRSVRKNSIASLLFKLRRISTANYFGKFMLTEYTQYSLRYLIKLNLLKIINPIPRGMKKYFYFLPYFLLSKFDSLDIYELKLKTEYFLNFKEVNYEGLKIKIPEKAKKYLEDEYGDWKKPPKDPDNWKWWENGKYRKITQPRRWIEEANKVCYSNSNLKTNLLLYLA